MKLMRFRKKGSSVMGILKDTIGGTYFTLERSLNTIPTGTYIVSVCMSPHFGKMLPLIYNENVSASRGIRIHAGNTISDTKGCILIGNAISMTDDYLSSSERALTQLIYAIKKSGDATLTIEDI